MANQNPAGVAGRVIFVKAFKSRGRIDGIAHHSELQPVATSDAACDSRAAKNTDAHLHGRSSELLPISIQPAKLSAHINGAMHRVGGVLLDIGIGSKSTRKAEYGHDGVAHVFIDESAVRLNVPCERLHVIVNP